MSPLESTASFKKLPEEAPLIKRYKPEYFSQGGEHLVYRVPDHPDVVIKASTHKIANILSKHYADQAPEPDDLREQVTNEFASEVATKNKEVADLRETFGKEHTLAERRYLMQVPVTKEIVRALYDNDHFKRTLPESFGDTKEVWTHVAVQSFTPEASNPERLSFSFGGLVETNVKDAELYDEVTRATIGTETVPDFENKFLDLQDASPKKDLTRILLDTKTDKGLHHAVSDFIRRAIEYSSKTGQILALGGSDNAFFYKTSGKWSYILMDVVPIPSEKILEESCVIETKIRNFENLTPRERFLLERALNYVRVINGSAQILGLKERIEFPDVFSSVSLLPIMQGETWSPQ